MDYIVNKANHSVNSNWPNKEEIAIKAKEYLEIINNDKEYLEKIVNDLNFIGYLQLSAVDVLQDIKKESIKVFNTIEECVFLYLSVNNHFSIELIVELVLILESMYLKSTLLISALSLHRILAYVVYFRNCLIGSSYIQYAYFKNGKIVVVEKYAKIEKIKVSVTFNRSAVDNG